LIGIQNYQIDVDSQYEGISVFSQSFSEAIDVTDPCEGTQIQSAFIPNMATFLGYSVTTTDSYTFTDSVSEQMGINDFCGTIFMHFTIESVVSVLLAFDGENKIVFDAVLNEI
jgi:hypothetical protein